VDAERELLKGNTPTLVLAVLKDGPLHGYGIARAIEQRSGNALRFKEGTLYPALHALERDGAIRGEWQRADGMRERKVYTITPAGLAQLERRTRTWTEFATAVYQVIGGDTHAGAAGTPAEQQPRRPIRPVPDPEPAH
jgi:PadR family transcriptional regulator PadR